jgi:ATP-dependent DNA helicase RecQ
VVLCLHPKEILQEKLEKRHELATFIVEFLYEKSILNNSGDDAGKEEVLVEFSVHELKDAFENSITSFGRKVSIEDVEDTLFYLSRIDAIKIEGGFLVVYNRLTIERLKHNNKIQYKIDDYEKLNQFY